MRALAILIYLFKPFMTKGSPPKESFYLQHIQTETQQWQHLSTFAQMEEFVDHY